MSNLNNSIEPFTHYLPDSVARLLRRRMTAEFATISKAGVPIDTPTYFFPSEDLATLDVGTGLAYPAKAERARRNPKVGMLIEGGADDPVVSVAGYAAVRDADLQSNLERYLAETIFSPNVNPDKVSWEKVRALDYYLPRIIVCVAPVHVRWWPNRSAMNTPPEEWRADAKVIYPKSDPAPLGKPTTAPKWPLGAWQDLAKQAVDSAVPAHLTLVDSEGFPLPIRVRQYDLTDNGFSLLIPAYAPWSQGQATLSFLGKEIFVGSANRRGDNIELTVERALPVLPMMDDRTGLSKENREILLQRLTQEAGRRGQVIPTIPVVPPEPTIGARLRAEEALLINAEEVGGGISRE